MKKKKKKAAAPGLFMQGQGAQQVQQASYAPNPYASPYQQPATQNFVHTQQLMSGASSHQAYGAVATQQQQFNAPIPQAPAATVLVSGNEVLSNPGIVGNFEQAAGSKTVGKTKKSWCWKCSSDSHSAKECKVAHYCYICDKIVHPTIRCPVLKTPKPIAFGTGIGQIDTYFTTLPDSVVLDELAPSRSPIARVVVSDDILSADVVAKQVARRCPDKTHWKWEALPNGENEFLVSLPSFDDLDRVDGIQVGVPSSNAKISISAWQTAEVPHKIELEQVWLHVDGVPHTVRHFLGLWAVGTLMGKTLDVDLLSLRRRGVCRILVAMFDSKILDSKKDSVGSFVTSDVVVKLKGYEFRFMREPTGFIPEPDFVPFIWKKGDDGGDDGTNGKEKEDAMDTSDSVPTLPVTTSTLPLVGAAMSSSSSGPHASVAQFVVTPFNPNPKTPLAIGIVEKLRKSRPSLENKSVSPTKASPAASLDSVSPCCISLDAACEEGQPPSSPSPTMLLPRSLFSAPARGRVHTLARVTPSAARMESQGHGLATVAGTVDPLPPAILAADALGLHLPEGGGSQGGQVGPGISSTGAGPYASPREGLTDAAGMVEPASPSTSAGMDAGPDGLMGSVVAPATSSALDQQLLDGADAQEGPAGPLPSTTLGSPPSSHKERSSPTPLPSSVATPVQGATTPSRRSTRHVMGADGSAATDEDSMTKAMRRKAAVNLDDPGTSGCSKSFLAFSTPTISAKLNSVGVSLGSSDNVISISSNVLKHMEFDRIKCIPKFSSIKNVSLSEDEDDAYAITDGQLLSHLIGEVSEVGTDEAMPGSMYDLKASDRKSKSSRGRKGSKPVKKAKLSKTCIVSK
jgi:hypothetical protein